MTVTIAPIEMSYAGVDLQTTDYSIFLQISAGLDDSPEVRGEDVTIPHLDGRLIRPRRFDRRRILLDGFVRGIGADREESMELYRAKRRLLATTFDAARVPATLRLVLEDGDVTRIEARPLSIIAEEVIKSEFAYISVELEAVSDWEGLGS